MRYGTKVEEKFVTRGYGEQGVKRQIKEGLKMERGEVLERAEKRRDERINFVLTQSVYLPNVSTIIKRHGHYLREDAGGQANDQSMAKN